MKCANTAQAFHKALKYSGFYDSPCILNTYYSLAAYQRGIPINDEYFFTIPKSKWKSEHWKEMTAYDFVVDIDCKDMHEAKTIGYESALMVHDWLVKRGFDVQIRFSGKGFHLVVTFEQFQKRAGFTFHSSFDPDSEESIYSHYQHLASEMHDSLTEWIDLGIYDSRRVIKLPFTLSFYKEETGVRPVVAYPFSSIKEFKYFNFDNLYLENFIKINPEFPYDRILEVYHEKKKCDSQEEKKDQA